MELRRPLSKGLLNSSELRTENVAIFSSQLVYCWLAGRPVQKLRTKNIAIFSSQLVYGWPVGWLGLLDPFLEKGVIFDSF